MAIQDLEATLGPLNWDAAKKSHSHSIKNGSLTCSKKFQKSPYAHPDLKSKIDTILRPNKYKFWFRKNCQLCNPIDYLAIKSLQWRLLITHEIFILFFHFCLCISLKISRLTWLKNAFVNLKQMNAFFPENHSQLLRPSYTPKTNDYGIDRVSL